MTVQELALALVALPPEQQQLPVVVVCKDYWLVLAEEPTLVYRNSEGRETAVGEPVIRL